MVAHNVQFDARTLNRNLEKFQIPLLTYKCADTMDLAKILKKKGMLSGQSISLEALVTEFGLETNGIHHDAVNDTKTMIMVANAMARKLGFSEFSSWLSQNETLLKDSNQFM